MLSYLILLFAIAYHSIQVFLSYLIDYFDAFWLLLNLKLESKWSVH